MTTTLSEGVKVPDVGSVNWAGDLEVNWNLLNGALANLSGNVKLDRDNTWTGEQSFTLPIVGSITGTASKAIADEDGTSIKTGYVNVAGNQTVTGDKSFTGSNTFNNILPNATNTYALGSSSYQWKSVYSQTYYYNGTAWGLDKANVWTGNNEYKSVLGLTGGEIWFKDPAIEDITSNPSSDISKSLFQFYNKTQTQYTGGIIERYLTDGTHQINISCLGFQLNNYGVYYAQSFYFEAKRDGTGSFFPSLNNVNLGTSTNKWKTLNGVNPGALSLPSFSSSDPTMLVWSDLDITNWLLDGNGNAVSIALDGYVYVSVTCGTDGYVVITEGQYGYPNCFYMSTGVHIGGVASALLPVRKGIGITVYCKGTSITHARFFPMQGNV